MKKNLRTGIWFMALLFFWGLLYPQYALTEEMYRVTENGRAVENRDCAADFRAIRAARPGEVELRFSLLEKLEEWIGERESDEDTGK